MNELLSVIPQKCPADPFITYQTQAWEIWRTHCWNKGSGKFVICSVSNLQVLLLVPCHHTPGEWRWSWGMLPASTKLDLSSKLHKALNLTQMYQATQHLCDAGCINADRSRGSRRVMHTRDAGSRSTHFTMDPHMQRVLRTGSEQDFNSSPCCPIHMRHEQRWWVWGN